MDRNPRFHAESPPELLHSMRECNLKASAHKDARVLIGNTTQQPMAAHTTSARLSRIRSLEQSMPPALRPVIRAFLLGYLSSTAPRLLTLLLTHLSRRRKNIDEKPDDAFLPSLIRILRGGLEIQRFPFFCSALVGGQTLLQARDQESTPATSPARKRVLTSSRYLYKDLSE